MDTNQKPISPEDGDKQRTPCRIYIYSHCTSTANMQATVDSNSSALAVLVAAAIVTVVVALAEVVVVVAVEVVAAVVIAVAEVVVFTLILTAIGRIGRRPVEETGRCCHSEVWHASVAIAVHAVADCVAIVILLRGGAWCITPWRHTAGVTTVTNWKKKGHWFTDIATIYSICASFRKHLAMQTTPSSISLKPDETSM